MFCRPASLRVAVFYCDTSATLVFHKLGYKSTSNPLVGLSNLQTLMEREMNKHFIILLNTATMMYNSLLSIELFLKLLSQYKVKYISGLQLIDIQYFRTILCWQILLQLQYFHSLIFIFIF